MVTINIWFTWSPAYSLSPWCGLQRLQETRPSYDHCYQGRQARCTPQQRSHGLSHTPTVWQPQCMSHTTGTDIHLHTQIGWSCRLHCHTRPQKKEQEEIGVSDDQAGLCCMVGKVGFVQGTFVQVTFVLVTFVKVLIICLWGYRAFFDRCLWGYRAFLW